MSFLSKHLNETQGAPDPVAGPGSPHYDNPYHAKPEPAATPKHRVIHDGQRETPYEHEPYPRLVYKAKDTKLVHTIEEHQEALHQGWLETPPKEND